MLVKGAYAHEFYLDDLPTFLGSGPRPRDRAEDKYHLTLGEVKPLLLVDPATIDLTQTYSLAAWKLPDGTIIDCRPDITDQMRLGSCAAWAVVEAIYMACLAAGMARDVVKALLHAGILYSLVRKVEKSFPSDAGSYPADCLDIAINQGLQWLTDAAYDGTNAADDYPQLVTIAVHVLAASHHAFFPTDGKDAETFARSFAASIASGLPPILSVGWCNEFFTPNRGVLPSGCTAASIVGGHAITAWQWDGTSKTGDLGNHWTRQWASDAPSSGIPNMRAGDFAMPLEYMAPSANIIFEGRSVTSIGNAPAPTPTPTPDPNPTPGPTPTPSDDKGKIQSVINDFTAKFKASPRSTSLRYELKGAQAALAAIE